MFCQDVNYTTSTVVAGVGADRLVTSNGEVVHLEGVGHTAVGGAVGRLGCSAGTARSHTRHLHRHVAQRDLLGMHVLHVVLATSHTHTFHILCQLLRQQVELQLAQNWLKWTVPQLSIMIIYITVHGQF